MICGITFSARRAAHTDGRGRVASIVVGCVAHLARARHAGRRRIATVAIAGALDTGPAIAERRAQIGTIADVDALHTDVIDRAERRGAEAGRAGGRAIAVAGVQIAHIAGYFGGTLAIPRAGPARIVPAANRLGAPRIAVIAVAALTAVVTHAEGGRVAAVLVAIARPAGVEDTRWGVSPTIGNVPTRHAHGPHTVGRISRARRPATAPADAICAGIGVNATRNAAGRA